MNTRKLQKTCILDNSYVYIKISSCKTSTHKLQKPGILDNSSVYIRMSWSKTSMDGKALFWLYSICFNNECSCYNDWKYNFTSICLFSVSLYFLALIPILLYPGHSTVIVCIVKCSLYLPTNYQNPLKIMLHCLARILLYIFWLNQKIMLNNIS